MKKLIVIASFLGLLSSTLYLTSCQKEENQNENTTSVALQNSSDNTTTASGDLKAGERAISIPGVGVTWNGAGQSFLTPYKSDCSQVSIGGNIPIHLTSGVQVTFANGVSRIFGTTAKVVVTTDVASNVPNQILIVDAASGLVLSNVTAKVNGMIIALKDIEMGLYAGAPKYYAVQVGTRRIYSVDIVTGMCTPLALVPGAGTLHGLATTNTNRVYVIQTNVAACAGRGLMWRYNVTSPAPTIAAAGNQNYIGTPAMMNNEGGLSYIFLCPNNPFQFANFNGIFSNATGPVGCAPAAALTAIIGAPQRFQDTTLFQ
ncbi:MAG: hypothetical protein ACOYOA_03075 [Saprospiraceae bacterium]